MFLPPKKGNINTPNLLEKNTVAYSSIFLEEWVSEKEIIRGYFKKIRRGQKKRGNFQTEVF